MYCAMGTLWDFMRYKTGQIEQMKHLTSLVHSRKKKKKNKNENQLSTVRENVTKCQNQNSYKIKQNIFLEIKTAVQTYWNSINQIHENGTPQQVSMSTLINTIKQNIREGMEKGKVAELFPFLGLAAICLCGLQKVGVRKRQG